MASIMDWKACHCHDVSVCSWSPLLWKTAGSELKKLPGLARGRTHSWAESFLSREGFWGVMGRFSRRSSISSTLASCYIPLENMEKHVECIQKKNKSQMNGMLKLRGNQIQMYKISLCTHSQEAKVLILVVSRKQRIQDHWVPVRWEVLSVSMRALLCLCGWGIISQHLQSAGFLPCAASKARPCLGWGCTAEGQRDGCSASWRSCPTVCPPHCQPHNSGTPKGHKCSSNNQGIL